VGHGRAAPVLLEAEMDLVVNDNVLEEGLAKIEGVRAWSPRLISKLENTIRSASDEDLFRVNPLTWASQKSVDEYEAVDLFLHAAKAGLFYMEWNVVCPCCGMISQSLRHLHGLESLNTCSLCFLQQRTSLDDYVQIAFTVSPAVRPIRFHDPKSLSLDEYCFTYLFEPSTRIAGFMSIRDIHKMTQRHFSTFAPGEKITVETESSSGILSCFNVFTQQALGLRVSGEPAAETQRLSVRLTENGFELPLPGMLSGDFNIDGMTLAGVFYPVRPGRLVIEFEQCTSAAAALLVVLFPVDGIPPELVPAGMDLAAMGGGGKLPPPNTGFASPRLTAKRLFASQTFHELFRAEVFQESEGFGVKDVTILFTDLKSSTQLYQQIGDLNAYALVREHYGILNQAVLHEHGAVVKTIGDAIMAAFDQPVNAVGAGLEMLTELRRLNQDSRHGGLVLKIGIHRGAAISVTLNEQIDYFGQTVNIASRVQGSAGGDEIYLTGEIYNASGVAELLTAHKCQTEPVQVQLRGVEEQVQVYRVSGA
jgi:class 3 adenylate cyclase